MSVWVDWSQNRAWSAQEVVLGNRGEWYFSNFSDMLFSTVVEVPGTFSGVTYARVALGWDYEPVNPCQHSWTWGDVQDRPMDLAGLSHPLTNVAITVKGRYHNGPTFQDQPQTGTFADYEAVMDLQPGVTVQTCKWRPEDYDRGVGELVGTVTVISPTQVTCTASRAPKRRDVTTPNDIPYGKRTVMLLIEYSISGAPSSSPAIFRHGFDLFYGKWDPVAPGVRVPSWFVWWGVDGAVRELKDKYSFDYDPLQYKQSGGALVEFVDNLPDPGHYFGDLKGTGPMRIGTNRALNLNGLTFSKDDGSHCFTEPATRGITGIASVVRHEGYHRTVEFRRHVTDWQSITPTLHSDSDDLPDSYEIQTAGSQFSPGYTDTYTRHGTTDKNDPDTCNVGSPSDPTHGYHVYGDQELEARVAAARLATVDPTKDWANPGARSGWQSGGDPDFPRW